MAAWLAQRVQCCEVCGVVAHDGTCARKAAHDCRPVTEASESMVHLWQPAGTVYYDSEVHPFGPILLLCRMDTLRNTPCPDEGYLCRC